MQRTRARPMKALQGTFTRLTCNPHVAAMRLAPANHRPLLCRWLAGRVPSSTRSSARAAAGWWKGTSTAATCRGSVGEGSREEPACPRTPLCRRSAEPPLLTRTPGGWPPGCFVTPGGQSAPWEYCVTCAAQAVLYSSCDKHWIGKSEPRIRASMDEGDKGGVALESSGYQGDECAELKNRCLRLSLSLYSTALSRPLTPHPPVSSPISSQEEGC